MQSLEKAPKGKVQCSTTPTRFSREKNKKDFPTKVKYYNDLICIQLVLLLTGIYFGKKFLQQY
jgi:hypothetical protein